MTSAPPVAVRASSLGTLFDCPARWEAINIDGKRMPSKSNAAIGKAIHAGTAAYDFYALQGQAITADEAAGVAIDALYRDAEVDWGEDDPADAEKIVLALHEKYCHQIAPLQRYVGVEVLCDDLLIEDLGLILTGTIDRVRVSDAGDHGIVDVKTGKTAVKADGTVATAGHAAQIGVYELLAEHALAIPMRLPAQIVGLTTAKTSASQRVGIGEITGARDMLVGDESVSGALRHAASLIKGGIFYGNPRSMLCNRSYCPIFKSCHFRK